MAAVGSLLDHSGPIGESEKYAARVFGAHRSYTVTNGTSGSNRIIFMASLTQNDIALCDRNCHKSIEHGLVMTGAIPVYLVPHRNRYGIIGPIYPEDLQPEAVRTRAGANPLTAGANRLKPRHTIITNSTYDGLIYNVERVIEIGGDVIDRLHFDEAWYAYARFNPLYRGRHAMFGDPAAYKDGPTLFATHSTHKLLAALSQASFIHIRDGRDPIEHARFNESFMMHASTSPFYPIIASNEISAAMMDGASGVALTTESIREAVSFRQTVGRIKRQYAQANDWFFSTWNATEVTDPATRAAGRFRRRAGRAAGHRPRLLGAASRRDVAWVRRAGRRLLHARPDQGHGRGARHRDRWLVRTAWHPGRDHCGLSGASWVRVRKDSGLHGPLPVLDRHDQGQVGHAADHADQVQRGLRRQRAAERRPAEPRRRLPRTLRVRWACAT